MTKKAPLIDGDLYSEQVFTANSSHASSSHNKTSNTNIAAMKAIVKAYVTANNGRQPTDPSQLLPYATNAEQKSTLQEMIRMQSSDP